LRALDFSDQQVISGASDMSPSQTVTTPPSAASVKNSAARVAAEKARIAKAQPKFKAKTIRRAVTQRVSDQERYEMIAEAAYFRAADRDFAPGQEIGDWLAAEKEVEQLLK